MSFNKLTAFTQKVADAADRLTGNAPATKAIFDAAPEELRTYFNNLIDALKSTSDTDSGAKNLGAKAITGLTGTDVQTLLENLMNSKAGNTLETTTTLSLMGGAIASNGRGIRVFKDTLGLVHLSIDVDLPNDTNIAWQIATLPEGYRPAVKISQTIAAQNTALDVGFGELSINTDGSIIFGIPSKSTWRYFHINLPAFKTVN